MTPAALLQRLIETGTADDEVAGWLAEGFGAWLASRGDVPLLEALALPPNGDRCRRAMRDAWLREAAEFIPGTTWQKARRLCDEARRFELRQWSAWKGASIPPAHASELQGRLFLALKAGAPLPGTPQAFLKVLTKTL